MKKLLAALLALSFTLCTAFTFTACDLDDLLKKPDSGDNGGESTDGNQSKDDDGTSDGKGNPPDCGTYYRVTVTGVDRLFYEPLENLYEAGTEVEVKLNVITDVSLYVFVNEKRVTKSHYDSDYWGYKFTMPEEDVIIYITMDKYYGVEVCDFNVPFYWVNYCQSENVIKIKCESGYIGVCPDILPEIIYTTDKTDIENVCAIFNYKLKPCANPHIDGGSYVIYTFYTADGGEYELEIDNGFTSSISFTTYDCFKIVDFVFPQIG